MYACDFEYDGQYLSDYGFIICNFGGTSDFDTVSAGSKITFNTVSRHRGKIHSLVGTQYDECITSTFQICKNPEKHSDMHITNNEYRDIMRWLNRNEFLKFQVLYEDDREQDACFYEASFNIDKILINKVLYGLELTMETNKPFGYGQEITVSWDISNSDIAKTYVLSDMSDEIGYTYPTMVITCTKAGDLSIRNETENCTMVIKNVSSGEVITVDGSTGIIESSMESHKIYDDFNFEFFRIGNTISNRNNKISVSIPCNLELTYAPIIKDTPN